MYLHPLIFIITVLYFSQMHYNQNMYYLKIHINVHCFGKKKNNSIVCVCGVSQPGRGTVCYGWWMWGSTIWRSLQPNSQMTLFMSARLQRLPCAPAEPNSPFSVSVCVCKGERKYVALDILLRKYYTGLLSNKIQIQKSKTFCHVIFKATLCNI